VRNASVVGYWVARLLRRCHSSRGEKYQVQHRERSNIKDRIVREWRMLQNRCRSRKKWASIANLASFGGNKDFGCLAWSSLGVISWYVNLYSDGRLLETLEVSSFSSTDSVLVPVKVLPLQHSRELLPDQKCWRLVAEVRHITHDFLPSRAQCSLEVLHAVKVQ
jgi:hypothetical protein